MTFTRFFAGCLLVASATACAGEEPVDTDMGDDPGYVIVGTEPTATGSSPATPGAIPSAGPTSDPGVVHTAA